MGRTGHLFAYQHYNVLPDVMTVAKGLGGGLPIGAAIARGKAASLFSPGDHASTFGGNPVSCAAAVQVLKTMDARMMKMVRQKGARLLARFEQLRRQFPSTIRQVRGIGMMFGIELTRPADRDVVFCRENGLLINCTQENIIRLLPPLTVSEKETDFAVATLTRSFLVK